VGGGGGGNGWVVGVVGEVGFETDGLLVWLGGGGSGWDDGVNRNNSILN
jgi:hypothetical protein